MSKIIYFFITLLASTLMPILILSLLLPSDVLQYIVITFVLIFTLIFLYADKIILFLMEAREIIESDAHDLFMSLKNICFKHAVETPKVFIYSGEMPKFFYLQSRGINTLVIEREVYDHLNVQEYRALTKFCMALKKDNSCWFLTKGIVLSSLALQSVYFIAKMVRALRFPGVASHFIKVVGLVFIKPYLDIIEKLSQKNELIPASPHLSSLYYKCGELATIKNFSDFIFIHLKEVQNFRVYIINHIESFPIIEKAKF
jgi:hypothetical protein